MCWNSIKPRSFVNLMFVFAAKTKAALELLSNKGGRCVLHLEDSVDYNSSESGAGMCSRDTIKVNMLCRMYPPN